MRKIHTVPFPTPIKENGPWCKIVLWTQFKIKHRLNYLFFTENCVQGIKNTWKMYCRNFGVTLGFLAEFHPEDVLPRIWLHLDYFIISNPTSHQCTHTHTHTHAHTHPHKCTHTLSNTHTHTDRHAHTALHKCTHTHIQTHTDTHTNPHTNVYTHTHTHTNTHTYTQSPHKCTHTHTHTHTHTVAGSNVYSIYT